MFLKKKAEKNTFGIIGLGKFGMSLALNLAQTGEEILVLDSNEDNIREIREYTENVFLVHSLDKNTLAETGIQNCDVVVVCIGEKLDTSILTTLNLVAMGVKRVISKANGPEHGEILQKLGAEIVFPEHDMALRLAHSLKNSSVLDFIQLSEKINVTKLGIPECMLGKTVVDINFRGRFNLNIIAVENCGDVIETVKPDYVFRQNDLLYLSGSRDGFTQFGAWLEQSA